MFQNTNKYHNRTEIFKSIAVIFVILLSVIAGVLLTHLYNFTHPQPIQDLASANKTAAYRQQFINQYFTKLTSCGSSDNVSAAARVSEFYQYLKINGYANRIVARGCNDIDNIYFRVNGTWQEGFTIGLNFSQYYKWQQECEIQDITSASYVEPRQNNSIDQINYDFCNYVLKHNKLPSLPQL